jgi:hypothetical protein
VTITQLSHFFLERKSKFRAFVAVHTDSNDPNRGRVLVFDQQQHQQVAREDFQTLLFREFFEALVRLAFHLYANEAPELSLAQAAKRLMLDRVSGGGGGAAGGLDHLPTLSLTHLRDPTCDVLD